VKHHRRSPRLKGYDYSQEGAYFITVCTHRRESLFGEVVGEQMQLSAFGQITTAEIERIPLNYRRVDLDAFVVMPNHIHLILVFFDTPLSLRGKKHGLPEVVRRFKTWSARKINIDAEQQGV
jgi:putative transposase